jgi:hypothetical protein
MGAAEPPGMWIVGGGIGATRAGARRVGPAVAYSRIAQTRYRITSNARPTGISPTSAPQSGVTNVAATSRRVLTMSMPAGAPQSDEPDVRT